MKAINYHIRGIITSLEYLFKGKYLIYFLPGLILTGIFWYFNTKLSGTEFSTSYSWLEWLESPISWVLDVLESLNETL